MKLLHKLHESISVYLLNSPNEGEKFHLTEKNFFWCHVKLYGVEMNAEIKGE